MPNQSIDLGELVRQATKAAVKKIVDEELEFAQRRIEQKASCVVSEMAQRIRVATRMEPMTQTVRCEITFDPGMQR